MSMSNEDIIQKADMTLASMASAGKLPEARASQFIRTLIDHAELMPICTNVAMKSYSETRDKIKFGSRVLRAGNESTALSEADRATPDLAKVTLDAKLFKAETRLSYETLEDSIEQGRLAETIMELLAEAIARDMDEVLIKGDTASADVFLAQFDGLLKQITSNTYDHADATANGTLWKSLLKTLPTPFQRDKRNLKFLTSINAEIDWRDAVGGRATMAGDEHLLNEVPVRYAGIPVKSIALFPQNIGTGSHCTNSILMNPANYMVGVWREVQMESQKDIKTSQWMVVTTLRFGAKLQEETACVKANNVKSV